MTPRQLWLLALALIIATPSTVGAQAERPPAEELPPTAKGKTKDGKLPRAFRRRRRRRRRRPPRRHVRSRSRRTRMARPVSLPPSRARRPRRRGYIIRMNSRPYRCTRPRGRTHYRCFGAAGLRALAKAVHRRRGRLDRSAALLAARLNAQAAVPALRQTLTNPNNVFELATAAKALALLGDKASAKTLSAIFRRYARSNATVRRQAWRALCRLDPRLAEREGKALVASITAPQTIVERALVRDLLPLLVERKARWALPALRRWSRYFRNQKGIPPSISARILGTRMRLGDQAQLRHKRAWLARRNAPVPVHPHYVVAGLGDHPADIPGLVRFAGAGLPEGAEAFRALERLIPKLNVGQRRRLRAALAKLSAYRRGKPQGSQAARHFGTLTRLGDGAAARTLLRLAAGPPRWPSSWVAARYALTLKVKGGASAAVELLARGKLFRARGSTRQYKRALIEAAAKTLGNKDGRWTAALLDWNVNERHLALRYMARLRPAGACKTITALAPTAHPDGAHDGLLALTFLGKRCLPELRSLAKRTLAAPNTDPQQLEAARGMALEVLAMLGEPRASLERLAGSFGQPPPSVPRGARRPRSNHRARAYRRRALQIATLRGGAPRGP